MKTTRTIAIIAGTMLVLAALLSAGCGGGRGSGGNLRSLAERQASLTSAEVKSGLDALSQTEHLELEVLAPAFKQYLFRRACQADPSIQWTSGSRRYDCNLAFVEYQQALQWVLPGTTVEQEAETQRLRLLNYFMCRSGEIDKGTCAMYVGVTSQLNQSRADTNQTIIDNLGNKCVVGQDPGCYP